MSINKIEYSKKWNAEKENLNVGGEKLEHTNEKVVLPSIIGHTSSDGCYNEVDIYGNPIFSKIFSFIDEKEKLKYGSDQYCEFSYDDEGNCTITKKLCKTLQ